ncbi:hypothetical protein Tco_1293103 [Tanacetum coccineum]
MIPQAVLMRSVLKTINTARSRAAANAAKAKSNKLMPVKEEIAFKEMPYNVHELSKDSKIAKMAKEALRQNKERFQRSPGIKDNDKGTRVKDRHNIKEHLADTIKSKEQDSKTQLQRLSP